MMKRADYCTLGLFNCTGIELLDKSLSITMCDNYESNISYHCSFSSNIVAKNTFYKSML